MENKINCTKNEAQRNSKLNYEGEAGIISKDSDCSNNDDDSQNNENISLKYSQLINRPINKKYDIFLDLEQDILQIVIKNKGRYVSQNEIFSIILSKYSINNLFEKKMKNYELKMKIRILLSYFSSYYDDINCYYYNDIFYLGYLNENRFFDEVCEYMFSQQNINQ